MTLEELKKFEPLWDKWYVQELLGAGSYGEVYRITCQVYERTYEAALKVISIPRDKAELNEISLSCETKEDTISYYDRMRQDIVREIDLQEQLKGRTNIVSFEDHDIIPHNQGRDPGYDIFIRMELLEDFGSVIASEAKTWTNNREIVRLGIDVAEGMRVCHTHGIMHRDIKPGNIFRSKDGDYKIGDFGISRVASDSQMMMSIKGTYKYMAPEVYNHQPYDFRVDVYSLGMVLYHMLNKNRSPFLPLEEVPSADQNDRALIRRMQGEELPAPVLAGKNLAEIILKACSFEPDQRYSSMEQFRRALLMLTPADWERPKEAAAALNAAGETDEDDRTVAFVEPAASSGNLNKNPKNIKILQEESSAADDDRTVAMDMAELQAAGDVQVIETSKKKKKGIIIGAGVAAVALICIAAGIALFSGNADESAAPDAAMMENDADREEEIPEETLKETLEETLEEQLGQLPNEIDEPAAEIIVRTVPFCSSSVTVISKENADHLIFEGDKFDTVKMKGAFQVSENDETEVAGTLALDNPPETFEKSNDYEWTFTPDDTEHYEAVSGTVHITAVHREWVTGIDEVLAIEDKAALYQVDLTGCDLKDLSILEGAVNLAVLDAGNNDITDISVLGKCKLLQQIYLNGNADLKDVQPLLGLKKLTIFDLDNTAVSDEDKGKLEKLTD